MNYWQVGFGLMWFTAAGCCLLAEYWRRQWKKADTQLDTQRALATEAMKVVDYFIEHMLPIVAVIGHWPPAVDGPPKQLRDDALKALKGAADVGVTVQATVTTGKPTMH